MVLQQPDNEASNTIRRERAKAKKQRRREREKAKKDEEKSKDKRDRDDNAGGNRISTNSGLAK